MKKIAAVTMALVLLFVTYQWGLPAVRYSMAVQREMLKIERLQGMDQLWQFITRSNREYFLRPVVSAYYKLMERERENAAYQLGWGYASLKQIYTGRPENQAPQPDEYLAHVRKIQSIYQALKKASELAPDEGEPHFAMGHYLAYYADVGDGFEKWRLARQRILVGLKLEPESSIGYVALGFRTPDDQKALEAYLKAVKLDPKNPDAQYFSALRLRSLGRKEEARQKWLEFKKLVSPIVFRDKQLNRIEAWIFS